MAEEARAGETETLISPGWPAAGGLSTATDIKGFDPPAEAVVGALTLPAPELALELKVKAVLGGPTRDTVSV